MASGVPGVSTDVGGVKDVITSEDVGARVPNGDPTRWPRRSSVTSAIASGAGNPVCARGPPSIDRYGMDRLVNDIVALYRELLAR